MAIKGRASPRRGRETKGCCEEQVRQVGMGRGDVGPPTIPGIALPTSRDLRGLQGISQHFQVETGPCPNLKPGGRVVAAAAGRWMGFGKGLVWG